jgi:hypothetical protein
MPIDSRGTDDSDEFLNSEGLPLHPASFPYGDEGIGPMDRDDARYILACSQNILSSTQVAHPSATALSKDISPRSAIRSAEIAMDMLRRNYHPEWFRCPVCGGKFGLRNGRYGEFAYCTGGCGVTFSPSSVERRLNQREQT